MGGTRENESVPALRRAVRILDLVGDREVPPNAGEIARLLDLPRSSVHGLVAVMTELGLLEQTGGHGSGYRPGPRLLDWAAHVSSPRDLLGAFHHLVGACPELGNYTVSLGALDGDEVVYLASRASERGLGVHYNVGLKLPAIYTATGKIQLAAMTPSALREWISLYPLATWPAPLTARCPVTPDEVLKEIHQAAELGYALDDEQIHAGVWCFAAPVRDSRGMTVAGLGLSQPKPAHEECDPQKLARLAVSSAAELSALLGYRRRDKEVGV
ncbi:IclR family transcriptional regulator [Acetobacter estunensis NRIC 0472]|uniref:Helix-turn-helix domain-containing protein n=1 Tax=Acetobacter estunensis TaxID=104097 RepID=A0A967B765_9PROT|nr:IclR family transcriptional regulator [Acetobacter estunensis]NHO54015.1 helix-turn-helix domain-containing protein [Acetobacter estunensis]GBQ20573.1 IclR family transcriptional regulator [Acetobacter estunensis NRIC 0472]